MSAMPRHARVVAVLLATAVMAAAPSFVIAQPSLQRMVPFMTFDELAILNALRSAAADEGAELVVLPVGSWGRRIAERLEAAEELRARTPGLSNDGIMRALQAEHAELFAGPGSDFDVTVAVKSGAGGTMAEEARVVRNVRARVEKDLPERAALVKVMGERAWDPEKFSGKSGSRFALHSSRYAFRVSANGAATIPATAFYTERGLKAPRGLGARSTVWLDDAMGILLDAERVAAGTGLDPKVAQSRAAIKYWKKYGGFFEKELGESLPEHLRTTLMGSLDEMPADVRDLLRLEGKDLTDRLELMRTHTVRAADGRSVTALDQFFERTLESMRTYRDQVEVIDLVRRGRLAPTVEVVTETLSRWKAVQRVLLRAGGRVAGAAARHLLMVPALRSALEKYTTGDTLGFAREVAGMLADLAGLGEAAFAAEMADLGRELAAAGLIAAADAVIFDPLNQEVLATYYNTATDPHGVFLMEGSPFAGLSRETLYAAYRMSPEQARLAIERHAREFVALLPTNERLVGERVSGFWDLFRRLGFLRSGPGSLADALTHALMADWDRSRVDAERVLAWAELLSLGGYFVPQTPPLEVFVDGAAIAPDATHTLAWTLDAGATRAAEVYLVRRYGNRFAIPDAVRRVFEDSTGRRQAYRPMAGGAARQMMEVFEGGFDVGTPPTAPGLPPGRPVRLRGLAAVERWVLANTGTYETAPLALSHRTTQACPGWRITAPWTSGAGWQTQLALAYPDENGEGPIDSRTARFALRVTAPAGATEPCEVDEAIAVRWRAPVGGAERTFAIRLRATLTAGAVEAARHPDFTVSGRVTNRATGAPLPGARVELSGPRALAAVAGDGGRVTLAAVPPDRYTLTVTHAGFAPRQGPIDVSRDRSGGDFALTPLAAAEPPAPASRTSTAARERSSGLDAAEIARLDQLCACIVSDRADYNRWRFASAGFRQTYPQAVTNVSVASPGRFDAALGRCVGVARWEARYEPNGRLWRFEFDWGKSGGIPNPPATRQYPEGCCTMFVNGRCWRSAQ